MLTGPVLFVLPSFAGGGAERVCLALASGLARLGIPAELALFRASGPLGGQLQAGLTVHDLARPSLRSALLPLVRLIRELRPRVVVGTMGYVNLGILAVRSLLPRGTRIIAREANLPSLSLPRVPRGRLLRLGYRLLYPAADLILCSSQLMERELATAFGVPAGRLAVLPNPVDAARIRQAARTPIRAPGAGPRLVAAGRLTYQKGFDRLITVLADVPQAHLTILGDGPDRASLEDLAQRSGVASRVAFTGFADAPWPYYAGADALVVPSRWEGMPNAALEALACGTPVIAAPEAGALSEVAAEAPPGAVIFAAAGDELGAALAGVAPRPRTGPGPDLLPARYRLDEVVARFAAMVNGT